MANECLKLVMYKFYSSHLLRKHRSTYTYNKTSYPLDNNLSRLLYNQLAQLYYSIKYDQFPRIGYERFLHYNRWFP